MDVEYEPNSSNSDDGHQDIGTEYSAHHDLHDPILGVFHFCSILFSYFYSTWL